MAWLIAPCLIAPMPLVAQGARQRSADKTLPDLEKVTQQIIAGTNQFRLDHERSRVKTNPELTKAAQYFADFMARTDKYGHTADGKQPWERAAQHDYVYCIVAENIAYQYNSGGFTTRDLAAGFVKGWEESPPHRKNMLDPDVIDLGVAVARSSTSGKYYAVQEFGRPRSLEIVFKITNQTGSSVSYKVDDKPYTLKPRYTVTHQACRPPELEFSWEEEKSATYHPTKGTHFVIRKDRQGKYSVQNP
jgi:uncharacterized protein YkwD